MPFETLLLQGIHFGDRSSEVFGTSGTKNEWAKIQDLAGNAFHTWCCASVMLVSLCLRAKAYGNIRTMLVDSIVSPALSSGDSDASSDAGSLADLFERRDCLDELLRP